jgi:hypothetical protein
VLPADKRGPVRVETHNLTAQQTAETVEALNQSLPYSQERLVSWVEHVSQQQPKKQNSQPSKRRKQQIKNTSKRRKSGEIALLGFAAVQYVSASCDHVAIWCPTLSCQRFGGWQTGQPISTLLNVLYCFVHVAAHSSSGSDVSVAEEAEDSEECSNVSQEHASSGCDSGGAVSEDGADSDEQRTSSDITGKADGWAEMVSIARLNPMRQCDVPDGFLCADAGQGLWLHEVLCQHGSCHQGCI